MLAQHIARLRSCLQQASGEGSGPEEGSDAWLLLNAFIENAPQNQQALLANFEESGHWLAEQGGRLDVRIAGLQRYVDASSSEIKLILHEEPLLIVETIEQSNQYQ